MGLQLDQINVHGRSRCTRRLRRFIKRQTVAARRRGVRGYRGLLD